MIESHSNQCSVDDIESDVFEELLTFIYTGKSPKAQSMAQKLLAVAEKYEILELKDICEEFIFKDLTNENAIQSLINADKYNAMKVLDKIIDYIVINLPFICEIAAIQWKTFITENPELIHKIFKAIAKKHPIV
jgi:hypothetical protein